jgi:pimeloyl-ACP methyl ester carboxylesterase
MSERSAGPAFLEAEARVFARWSLTPRSRTLQLRKPEFQVRTVEVGEGELALYLHGFSLCAAHMAPLISALPPARCIAIDQPGHGGSGSVDYSQVDLRRWFTEMLTSCMDELGLQSAHVIGHSQGAMIGMWLALDAPDRVRSLVAVGTPAVALGARLDGLRALARPGVGRLMLAMPKPPAMYRAILSSTIGAGAVSAAPADLIRANYLATQRPGYGKTVSSYLREMFRGLDAQPQRYVVSAEELARIEPPVLIVWGREEAGLQSSVEARQRAALIPRAQFELVPGGHEPWLDDLESTAGLIGSFMAGIPASRRRLPSSWPTLTVS